MRLSNKAKPPKALPRFSANLGFLWTDLPLPDAIRAAASAGFDAVEFHWPYDQDRIAIMDALAETGLSVMGLNTAPGDSFGLSALPDQEIAARRAIDQAVEWADALDALAIHVMAGKPKGLEKPEALAVFERNLRYACRATVRTILIEPINPHDVPGYFLDNFDAAIDIIQRLNLPNLKLMFDSYHANHMSEDVLNRLEQLLPRIGHVQVASFPNRAEPLDCQDIFEKLDALGWQNPIGAEYKPAHGIDAGLGWLQRAKTL